MHDLDKALEALKIQIKKEIIDNYFAERVNLEEDYQALQAKVTDYRHELAHLSRLFSAFYAALGQEALIDRVIKLLSLQGRPFYQDYQQLPAATRQDLLKRFRRRGFTARGRQINLVLDIYQEMVRMCGALQELYAKVQAHLRLHNEDVQKFNQSFDFGLIAAQIEAMEGGGEPICGGLECGEREELSTRMRFKLKRLTDEELPPPPALPPLDAVKGRLKAILREFLV